MMAGDLEGLDLPSFEAWTVAGADASRQGRSRLPVDRPPPDWSPEVCFALGEDGSVRPTEVDGDDVVAVATWGPASAGGIVAIDYTDELPVGRPTAPLTAEIARQLDERWSLGLGSLEAASPQPG